MYFLWLNVKVASFTTNFWYINGGSGIEYIVFVSIWYNLKIDYLKQAKSKRL